MEKLLNRIIAHAEGLEKTGKNASYIPALQTVSAYTGMAVKNSRGVFSSGDAGYRFTIQSMSKIMTLLLALHERGAEYVFSRVGMEPSGEPFNSISKLDFSFISKPCNPFINSGAILTASLIRGDTLNDKIEKIVRIYSAVLGRTDITFNREVYHSERDNSDRNRALVYLMKEKNLIQGPIEEILDFYFTLCSMEVSCIDLAELGAFLAFRKNSLGISESHIRICNTLMLTCGMYDYSGEFAVKTGLPGKSGVSGGIVSAVPGVMGIGVFSPGLDERGNSVLGIHMLTELNKALALNIFC